jgi:hypothetical protein
MSRATPSDYGTPEGDARLTAGRRARIAKNRRPVRELKDQHVFRPIIRGVRERIVPLLDPPPGAYGEIHTAEMHRQAPYIQMMEMCEAAESRWRSD